MNKNMPYTNYKILKERMSELSKGFWKVQSIHKLATNLSKHFNTKDFILMKNLKKSPQITPSFITFINESKLKNKNKSCLSKKIQTKPKKEKIFLTSENVYKKRNNSYNPKLYSNFFKNFPYEPFIYNDVQFFYLQGNAKYTPRKFNEVVRDCLVMNQYAEYIKYMKPHQNISNISNTNTSNTNTNTNINYGYKTCSNFNFHSEKKYKTEEVQNSGKRLSFNVVIDSNDTPNRLTSIYKGIRNNTLPSLKIFSKNNNSNN